MTLLDRIKKHEGFRSHAYLDSKGFLSIGYGTTVTRVYFEPFNEDEVDGGVELQPCDDLSVCGLMLEPEGVGITEEQAERMLQDRIFAIRDELYSRLAVYRRWRLLQIEGFVEIRADVLVEMAYQLGVDGLLGFERMLAALDRGDWEAASNEVLFKNGELPELGRSALWTQTPERAEYYAKTLRTGVAG